MGDWATARMCISVASLGKRGGLRRGGKSQTKNKCARKVFGIVRVDAKRAIDKRQSSLNFHATVEIVLFAVDVDGRTESGPPIKLLLSNEPNGGARPFEKSTNSSDDKHTYQMIQCCKVEEKDPPLLET